jgi:hypothetical protein
MKRLHLLEIEDQAWCPNGLRDALTDHLQFALAQTRTYAPAIPVLASALRRAKARCIVDLCSGGAGPWPWLHPALTHEGLSVTVCLTDRFPNLEAFRRSTLRARQSITYHPLPVDATQVPEGLSGFRTLFTSFHHFGPEQARAILADAVRQRQGIAIFEATYRHLSNLVLMLPAPLAVLGLTPFIRPFRWSRLAWTYLLPVAPLVTLFDGVVSCLRTYTVQELRNLTASLETHHYLWDVGRLKPKLTSVPITYLVGVPAQAEG